MAVYDVVPFSPSRLPAHEAPLRAATRDQIRISLLLPRHSLKPRIAAAEKSSEMSPVRLITAVKRDAAS